MNKSQERREEEGSRQSVGIGEYQAEPERKVVEWAAIYYEGKYYLTSHNTVSKLRQVQAEVELQKKLASSYNSQKQKAQSMRSIEPNNQSGYSCATEISPQKRKLKQLKAEQQLIKQEQMNIQRLIQARKKKGIEKKGNKNLIQVKQKNKEEFRSQKEEKIQEKEEEQLPINQSMMNKINPPKNTNRPSPIEAVHHPKDEQKNELIIENKQIEPQSPVNIFMDGVAPSNLKPPSVAEDHLASVCFKINIKEVNQTPLNRLSIKSQVFQQNTVEDKNHSHKKSVEDESMILKRVVIDNEKEKPSQKQKDISILDLASHEEDRIDEQLKNQRAGSSFFKEINAQMYKMRINFDQLNKEQKQFNNLINQEDQELIVKENHHQGECLGETKMFLEDLTHQLQSMEIGQKNIQTQQEQRELNKNRKLSDKSNQNGKKSIKLQQSSNNFHPQQPLKSQSDSNKPQIQIKSKPQQLQPLQKKFTFSPSIINYQISNFNSKQQQNSRNRQEKEKLQHEINVLQQVIGELRVERLKYQVSQNSKVGAQSCFQPMRRSDEENKLVFTPSVFQKSHRPSGTIINNIEESVVSQFQGSRLHRTKSGKIIKNVSLERYNEGMQRIQEQNLIQTKQRQAKAGETRKKTVEQERFSQQLSNKQRKQQPSQVNKQFLEFNEQDRRQFQHPKKDIQKIENKVERLEKEFDHRQVQCSQQQSKVIESEKVAVHPISASATPNYKDKQYQIKITKNDSKRKSTSSEPKNKHSNIGVVANQDDPLPNRSQRIESDLQSSMPRAILNKYNRSIPPRITVEERSQHQQMHQRTIKRNLMNNFQKLQRSTSRTSSIPQQQPLDPKRRAAREGVLKNIQYKISCNPELKTEQRTGNIKQRICQREQIKKEQSQSAHPSNQNKNIKQFRMRRDSQASRHSSRTSKRNDSKPSDNKTNKPKDSSVYVSALHEHSKVCTTPIQGDKQQNKFELKAKKNQKQRPILLSQGFQVQKRAISFTNIQIPKFPDPPQPNITVEQMVQLIYKIGEVLELKFQDKQMQKIIMKKYKNCIMLDLPVQGNNIKLVWHYNGKIYLGEWNEQSMMKSGEGIQFSPEKFYYKGQFLNNKKNGTGIILVEGGVKYEGQWLEGQKNGRGKYYDPSMGLYYEGQWISGKRDGYGYLEVDKQSIYQGLFSGNYRIGYGTQKFTNGDSYKGQYEKGKFHGKGIYIWASGSSYQGSFVEGKKEGQGKWRSQTGEEYIGDYYQDKKQRFGRYKWENGCLYQGEFLNDKKHGKGLLKYPSGKQIEGVWNEGQLVDLIPVDDKQNPLEPKKSKAYQTVTVIKVTETKPNKLSQSSGMAQI